MPTTHWQHYLYAKRPSTPGCYHVWTRDEPVRYLGRVYRVDGIPAGPWWHAGERDRTAYATRENAARALQDARDEVLERLHESLDAAKAVLP